MKYSYSTGDKSLIPFSARFWDLTIHIRLCKCCRGYNILLKSNKKATETHNQSVLNNMDENCLDILRLNKN